MYQYIHFSYVRLEEEHLSTYIPVSHEQFMR